MMGQDLFFKDTVQIIKFESEKHSTLIGELTKMLNKTYAPLAEQGMKYLASHQDTETTFRRLNRGPSYFAFLDSQLVGTVTLVMNTPTTICYWYRPEDHFFFTQFAVSSEFKGNSIGRMLMDFVEKEAMLMGAKELALDTSEKADRLIRFYKGQGYREVGRVKWDVTNYESVVLSKKINVIS